MLVVVGGLPGAGKTTIAREVARTTGAVYLRIDSIEQALRHAGLRVEAEGYSAAYAIAGENLRLGHLVVADCVNPWPLTRQEWQSVADRAGAGIVNVEIVCSDAEEHRRRVEGRSPDIPGHVLPTWRDVVGRDYRPWDEERLVIDTATTPVAEAVREILSRTTLRRR